MPKGRKGNGSGTIIFCEGRNKPYRVQCTLDGKRKSDGYFQTKAEAAKKLRQTTAGVDAGTYLDPSKLLLSEWMDT